MIKKIVIQIFSEDAGVESKDEIVLTNVLRGTINETTNFSQIRSIDNKLLELEHNYCNFTLSAEYKK